MGHRFPATLGGATQGVSSGNMSASCHSHSRQPAKQANPDLHFSGSRSLTQLWLSRLLR